jgi:hypothetical protein
VRRLQGTGRMGLPLASVPLCRLTFSSKSCGQSEKSVRHKSEETAER